MDGKGMNQQRMVLGGRVVKTEEGYGWDASEDDEVYEHGGLFGEVDAESNKKKKVVVADGDVVAKRGSSVAPPPPPPPPPPPGAGSGGTKGGTCQAEKCTADLTDAKAYHRRHKVCEHHAKAQVVLINGHRQRFCQQCSRFHDLSEFDDTKRSCRRRLAGHNERRRKNAAAAAAAAVATAESPEGEGSSSSRGKGVGSHQLKDMVCGQVNQRGRIRITIQENATYQHFQIR